MTTTTHSSIGGCLHRVTNNAGGGFAVRSRRWGVVNVSLSRKSKKAPRQLITIATSDGRWQGSWNSNYLLSLRELQLEDLVEGEEKDADVLVNLSVEKHASFGLSVDGTITTTFTRRCCNCFSPYCREIEAKFTAWVLPSSRIRKNLEPQLPEIGFDDPSVIFVKPGHEAHLDSLIQDTLRLATSVEDTCSDTCKKSEPSWQFPSSPKAASVDKRWSMLLKLKNMRH
ncbi:hypothetical protein MLD38_009898 [Melastoma candidum]|uniref:Uncharacterized protein n=1 Tax=Melastoma candidum TaxID=119954 RepID=A0ACB9RYM5_9MYRT|nr:hypothetical protein MLD38_009898 [Melastoma candidum]